MKRRVLTLAFLSLLGCSSPHSPRVTQQAVPAGRRFEPQLLHPTARRSCALTISREKDIKGSGLNLFLDGEQIARIKAGETVTLYVAPGRHRLSAKPLFSPAISQPLVLEKEEPAKIRIIDQDGNFQFLTYGGPWYASLERSFQELIH